MCALFTPFLVAAACSYNASIVSGDPEGAMAQADHVVEGTFKVCVYVCVCV